MRIPSMKAVSEIWVLEDVKEGKKMLTPDAAQTISRRLRQLKKIPPELLPLGQLGLLLSL